MESKKTVAPYPSAPTDGGQLPENININSIPATEEKINSQGENSSENLYDPYEEFLKRQNPDYLHTVAMGELMDMQFSPRMAIVEDLLYPGAYLFAGAPKIGKSFLVIQIAYHVSKGQPLWGRAVRKGAVLYLALEDRFQRLQERIDRMFDGEVDGALFLSVAAKQVGKGLDGQMNYFIQEHPDTRLIVIDTLQKVRESTGDYSYASDYEIITQLKTFAESHNLCILIVHHTRKQPAGDSFEMISGTTGLLGCADGAFLMYKERRTDSRAIVEVVGRDQADEKLYLTRNEERLTWEFERAEHELWKQPPDPLLEQVARLVTPEQPVWQGSGAELLEKLEMKTTASSLTRRLNVRAGQLYDAYRILYQNTRDRVGSHITLTLEIQQV